MIIIKTHKEISSLLYGLRAMMSLSALSPVAMSTMRGIRKNRIGTAERSNINTLKSCWRPPCLIEVLTPTDYGDTNYKFGCYSGEDNDQFLEHEQCLSSHPHHSHQCEVVHED